MTPKLTDRELRGILTMSPKQGYGGCLVQPIASELLRLRRALRKIAALDRAWGIGVLDHAVAVARAALTGSPRSKGGR